MLEIAVCYVYHFSCKHCGWPICGPRCQGLGKPYGHTKEECSILTESKSSRLLPLDDIVSLRTHFSAITPLRCLLLKTTDPEAYKTLMSMEAHNDIRKLIPEVWQGNQTLVVNRIRNNWGLDRFSEDEVHTICGILEVRLNRIVKLEELDSLEMIRVLKYNTRLQTSCALYKNHYTYSASKAFGLDTKVFLLN